MRVRFVVERELARLATLNAVSGVTAAPGAKLAVPSPCAKTIRSSPTATAASPGTPAAHPLEHHAVEAGPLIRRRRDVISAGHDDDSRGFDPRVRGRFPG